MIERLTPISDRELLYQFTVVDPKVYAAPWLGEFSWFRTDLRMFEHACHEGNYALPNILARACGLGAKAMLVPELMQDQCTAANLAKATLELFRDSERRGAIVAAFEQLHDILRGQLHGHAGDHAAAAIVELLNAPVASAK